MGLTSQLCEALEGIRFVYGGRMVLTLRAGLYGNGRGALQLEGPDGPYAVLTANLPDEELADDELMIRNNDNHADGATVRALVATTKFWESTGRMLGSGYVAGYAKVWKFRQCHVDGTRDAAGHVDGYRVLCPACRAAVVRRYEEQIETMLAADAVKRLTPRRRDEDVDE